MNKIAILFLVMASGCASPNRSYTEKIMGPNGAEAYAVQCRNGISKCYKRAHKACPGGYEIIESSKQNRGAVPMGNMIATITDTTMVIQCKN